MPNHQITWRKFDFTTLFDTFIGWKGKAFCQFTICCYCYGVLWAYSAVFSSSVASLFFQFALDEKCDIYHDPSASCNLAYHICLLIYVLIVVPLSCLGI
jgi:amino acid permease